MSTVLVVRVDEAPADGWALALEASGHTVITAGAMADGILRLREGGIDVVVVDANDGTGALPGFIRQLERLLDAPPFVLISASPSAPEVSAHLGAAAFLPKPCTSQEMSDAVDRIARYGSGTRRGRSGFEDEPTRPR